MAKVTSKYQVTVPRRIAGKYNLDPGVEITWVEAGEIIHVIPPGRQPESADVESKLRLFDQATARQRRRPSLRAGRGQSKRGWKREDLYTRGRSH
jgi:bifunctional DNA-binding transcriptional regulator/antitoxin component of YhaV-PrlF toxin-antitoxin module